MTNKRAIDQLDFLIFELNMIVGGKYYRYITAIFSRSFTIIASYRLNRFGYLLFGRFFVVIRGISAPIRWFIKPWTGFHDIHYEAEIGKGLRILHPGLGIMVSKKTIAGEHLTLMGGNAIGRRRYGANTSPVLGNKVTLGLQATVLGPINVGDGATIGAGAVAVKDVMAGNVVKGVPAT